LKGFVGLLAVGLGGVALASAHAQTPQSAPQQTPVTIPGAATVEFGEWPLDFADPDAVEAIVRFEMERVSQRFGEKLDFLCVGYSYGQPTPDFLARFAQIGLPIKGRLNCSPYVGETGFSVLIEVSSIRCGKSACRARSGLSIGETIERDRSVAASLEEGVWTVSLEEPAS